MAYETRRINGTDRHSDETKERIRVKCKGLNKKNVYVYDQNMELITIYESNTAASEGLGRSASLISTWSNNKSDQIFLGQYYISKEPIL